MGAGIPVVATRAGGNPELVEDGRTGFLFPVQNAAEIAGVVGRLLTNRTWHARLAKPAGGAFSMNSRSIECCARPKHYTGD
jgi:glycosyltransferase involved in cell wall biosynthesis